MPFVKLVCVMNRFGLHMSTVGSHIGSWIVGGSVTRLDGDTGGVLPSVTDQSESDSYIFAGVHLIFFIAYTSDRLFASFHAGAQV